MIVDFMHEFSYEFEGENQPMTRAELPLIGDGVQEWPLRPA
jgi:hypothetical protein